jgi:hypothetical protein
VVFSEQVAREFQDRYLQGERGAMAGLYAECRYIAEQLARSYLFKAGKTLSDGVFDDTVAVVVSRILARFQKPYRIRSFYRTINIEVVHELSKRGPKARFLNGLISLEAVPEQASPIEKVNGEGLRSLAEQLFTETNGKRIFFDLALYRSFRDACISIATYTSADRILTESRKLREIHRVIHGKGVGK